MLKGRDSLRKTLSVIRDKQYQRRIVDAAHEEYMRQMGNADIPVDSGRLKLSLQTQNSDHIFYRTNLGFVTGTRSPAGYNTKVMLSVAEQIDTDAIFKAIRRAVDAD